MEFTKWKACTSIKAHLKIELGFHLGIEYKTSVKRAISHFKKVQYWNNTSFTNDNGPGVRSTWSNFLKYIYGITTMLFSYFIFTFTNMILCIQSFKSAREKYYFAAMLNQSAIQILSLDPPFRTGSQNRKLVLRLKRI